MRRRLATGNVTAQSRRIEGGIKLGRCAAASVEQDPNAGPRTADTAKVALTMAQSNAKRIGGL